MSSAPELFASLSKRALVFGGVALVVIIGVIFAISNVRQKIDAANRAEQRHVNQAVVQDLARRLGAVLEPQRLKLKALAQKPAVVAALTADKATRDEVAAGEQGAIPAALLLRLLPRGADQIDPNSKPPLTFASVDMLHTAARNDKGVDAELHLSGTENEHVVMIQRVPLGGDIVGFLHLSLNSATVKAGLTDDAWVSGQVEVRQPVPKGPPIIIARFGPTPGDDSPESIAGIEGARWIVSYRPATALGAASGLGIISLIGATLVVAAIVVWLVAFVRSRVDRSLSSSDVIYQGAVKAILEGAHPGLEHLLPGGAGRGAPIDLGAASPGLDGEDITRFTSPVDKLAPEETTLPQPIDLTRDTVDGIEVSAAAPDEVKVAIDPSIFRAYDIRGVVGETLSAEGVYQIGRAIGSEAAARGQQTVITARDGRNSSQEIRDALIEGLRDSGRDVLDIGLTPTPVLYFATHYLDTHSGVMVTGSHNPPEYNGLKIVLDGESLSGEDIQAIRKRIEKGDLTTGEGTMQSTEIIPDYIRRISEEIPVTLGNALKVVVDCGNSVPGIVAPHILRAIGHDVIELYCEVDGNFPNHHPDPSQPENLQDLITAVQDEDADIGLAFDGDGDRLGVVDTQGNIIWSDRQMILFARDVLSRNPGAKIIYDVKCSRLLAEDIKKHGGEPIMARTGHSLIKGKMQETGALLAGEMSGHIFFKERWYGFDDALYSAARLLEILVNSEGSPDQVFAGLPGGVATPELRLAMPEDEHAEFMQKVIDAANFDDGEVRTLDGLRVDFADSWGLIRASNTTPCLVLRFEGDDDAALARVTRRFTDLLHKVDENLDLPF